MERIGESIEINATAEAVFGLISDLCRRARLNPAWRVVACEALDGEPIHVGARYRFVIRREETRVEHVSRVIAVDPPHRLVCRSEMYPDLEIALSVTPAPAGCVLTHEESFRSLPVPKEVSVQEKESFVRKILRALLMAEQGGFQTFEFQEAMEAARDQIRQEMKVWLVRIKETAESEGVSKSQRESQND